MLQTYKWLPTRDWSKLTGVGGSPTIRWLFGASADPQVKAHLVPAQLQAEPGVQVPGQGNPGGEGGWGGLLFFPHMIVGSELLFGLSSPIQDRVKQSGSSRIVLDSSRGCRGSSARLGWLGGWGWAGLGWPGLAWAGWAAHLKNVQVVRLVFCHFLAELGWLGWAALGWAGVGWALVAHAQRKLESKFTQFLFFLFLRV